MSGTPDDVVEPCATNLGPAQAQRRMRIGLGSLAVSGIVLGVLVATGAPRLARLALFLPLAVAAFSVFQAREKT